MRKRRLGKTGLMVSEVGFGGIPLQKIDQDKAKTVLEVAQEEGINFIDTARGYTISEELIGFALKDLRNDWIIATKAGSKDYHGMKEEINLSLEKLQVETIDLYQCHFVKDLEAYNKIMSENGAYKALLEAKSEGKINHIGITSHSADLLMHVLKNDSDKFETIQFPYNPVEQQGLDVFKLANELDIGVIIMKPIAGGAIDSGEISIKYIVNNDTITTVIPGMETIELVKKNAAIGSGDITLSEKEQQYIKTLQETLGKEFCRRCGYCAPCPQGINIPTQFVFNAYLTKYDLKDWVLERYNTLEKTAADCVACGECVPRCPYDLDIPKLLDNVAINFKNAQ